MRLYHMPVTAPGAEIEIQSQQEIEIQSQLGVSCTVVAIETQSQQGDPSCLDLTKSAGLQLRLSLNRDFVYGRTLATDPDSLCVTNRQDLKF